MSPEREAYRDRLVAQLGQTAAQLEAAADELLKGFEASEEGEGKTLRQHGILTADAQAKIRRHEVHGVTNPEPAYRRL